MTIHTFVGDENTIKNISPSNKCVLIAVNHLMKNCMNSIVEDLRYDFVRGRYEVMGLQSCTQVTAIFFRMRVMNVALRLLVIFPFI